jgi:predicted nucleic acid-binding protein
VIVVDSSVWIAVFGSGTSAEAGFLRELLDGDVVALAAPVRIEILVGASNQDRPRLRRLLSALPVYYPTADTWATLDRWVEKAASSGHQFGFADLFIGALAAEHDAAVWLLDGAFRRMAELGFLQIHEPS